MKVVLVLAALLGLACYGAQGVPVRFNSRGASPHQSRYKASGMAILKAGYPYLSRPDLESLYEIMMEKQPKIWPEQANPNIKFECPALTPREPAQDVNDLRPDDIKVVMAMGDSITAGFAENYKGILSGIQEYRGLSWSIGGDKDAITVPNFLKHYNPKLVGPSVGAGIPGRKEATSHLNAAVSGAIVEGISAQADYLISNLKAHAEAGEINLDEDWKLVTIMIGPNNLCRACEGDPKNGPAAYEAGFRETLDKLQANIPKLLVSIVPSPNVTTLYSISEGNLYCELTHSKLCPCAANRDKKIRDKTYDIGLQDHIILTKLAAEYQAKKSKDFTVVIQPFFIETQIPDVSYLSGLDCFHPNLYSHQDMAVALWNNMITKSKDKKHRWSPGEQPICPTDESRIWTV